METETTFVCSVCRRRRRPDQLADGSRSGANRVTCNRVAANALLRGFTPAQRETIRLSRSNFWRGGIDSPGGVRGAAALRRAADRREDHAGCVVRLGVSDPSGS